GSKHRCRRQMLATHIRRRQEVVTRGVQKGGARGELWSGQSDNPDLLKGADPVQVLASRCLRLERVIPSVALAPHPWKAGRVLSADAERPRISERGTSSCCGTGADMTPPRWIPGAIPVGRNAALQVLRGESPNIPDRPKRLGHIWWRQLR